MSQWHEVLSQRLAELKESFDLAFAEPRAAQEGKGEEFLIIRVGLDRCALRLDDLLGLQHNRKIVSLPESAPGLLGLAGLGGRPVPVFSLASLLDSGADAGSPPWIALCRDEVPVGIAFDQFERSARVAASNVSSAGQTEGSAHLVRQTVRLGADSLHVIDVPSVVAAAKQRLRKG